MREDEPGSGMLRRVNLPALRHRAMLRNIHTRTQIHCQPSLKFHLINVICSPFFLKPTLKLSTLLSEHFIKSTDVQLHVIAHHMHCLGEYCHSVNILLITS